MTNSFTPGCTGTGGGRRPVSASLKGNFCGSSHRRRATCDGNDRLGIELGLYLRASSGVGATWLRQRSPARSPGWTEPVPQRTETRLFTGCLIAWACVLITGRSASSPLTSFANQLQSRARAPHQTSSRDYANPIVSYPIAGKYRHRVLLW